MVDLRIFQSLARAESPTPKYPTTISQVVDLSITQGQGGATYTITVTNNGTGLPRGSFS
jgi:hypothetical protein